MLGSGLGLGFRFAPWQPRPTSYWRCAPSAPDGVRVRLKARARVRVKARVRVRVKARVRVRVKARVRVRVKARVRVRVKARVRVRVKARASACDSAKSLPRPLPSRSCATSSGSSEVRSMSSAGLLGC